MDARLSMNLVAAVMLALAGFHLLRHPRPAGEKIDARRVAATAVLCAAVLLGVVATVFL